MSWEDSHESSISSSVSDASSDSTENKFKNSYNIIIKQEIFLTNNKIVSYDCLIIPPSSFTHFSIHFRFLKSNLGNQLHVSTFSELWLINNLKVWSYLRCNNFITRKLRYSWDNCHELNTAWKFFKRREVLEMFQQSKGI